MFNDRTSTRMENLMRSARNSKLFKTVLGVTAAAVLTLPLAACGADDESAGGGKPEPVAQVNDLSGDNTAVLLDPGFVDALTSLKLKPGVVGERDSPTARSASRSRAAT